MDVGVPTLITRAERSRVSPRIGRSRDFSLLMAVATSSEVSTLKGIATAISFAATAIHNTRTLRHARALLNRGTRWNDDLRRRASAGAGEFLDRPVDGGGQRSGV